MTAPTVEDQNAGREWMRRAWYELNAIKARIGAPVGVSVESWRELTDGIGALLGEDRVPWQLDAAKKMVEPYLARAVKADSDNERLRAALIVARNHIADLNNIHRHHFSAAIEEAANELFRQSGGQKALRAIRDALGDVSL